jgi:hypothetical protein
MSLHLSTVRHNDILTVLYSVRHLFSLRSTRKLNFLPNINDYALDTDLVLVVGVKYWANYDFKTGLTNVKKHVSC